MDRTGRMAQISIIVIGVIATVVAMQQAEPILAPLALALVAGVVLSPLSDFWERRGYSPVWGALVGLVATIVIAGLLVMAFQPVIARLVAQAPKVWSDMQGVVHSLRGILRGVSEVSEDVASAIAPQAHAATAAPAKEDVVAMPSVTDAIMAAPAVLSQILIFVGALFFFLLTRVAIYDFVSLRLSKPGERAALTQRLRRAEGKVSRYFSTITIINAALGAATAAALHVIGLPDAIIWGVVAFVVNFLVYLGPAVFVVLLLFVGVAEFDGALALAPALSYVTLNTIEGQFVTPTLVGRHMSVNPLLVFLSLVFGIWLWGAIGGIVAIPLLLWVLVLNDAIEDSPTPQAQADQPA